MKLFTFGCSHTGDSSIYYRMGEMDPNDPYFRYMKIVKNSLLGTEPPRAWPFFLGKKLGCEVINFGATGASNSEIFSKICKECHNFSNSDLIIVGWSYNQRFRWVNEKTSKWTRLGPYYGPDPYGIINPGTHQDITINRSNDLYIEEIYDYEKMIDQLSKNTGFSVYYWSGDSSIIYKLPKELKSQKKYLINEMVEYGKTPFAPVFKRGGKTIKEETSGVVDDYHFGESAHIIMADLFYKHIIENPL